MTREEIKNIPEIVNFMLDKCVIADSRAKVYRILKEVCDLAITALEQEPKWIPISERPPEDRQKCLISIEEMVDIARYSTNLYEVDEYDFYDKNNVSGFYDYDGEYGYFQVYNVEAWMPLPESYKAESEGKSNV